MGAHARPCRAHGRKPDGDMKATMTKATDSGVRCTGLAARTTNNALPLAVNSWGRAFDKVLNKTVYTLPLVSIVIASQTPNMSKPCTRYVECTYNQSEVLGSSSYKDVFNLHGYPMRHSKKWGPLTIHCCEELCTMQNVRHPFPFSVNNHLGPHTAPPVTTGTAPVISRKTTRRQLEPVSEGETWRLTAPMDHLLAVWVHIPKPPKLQGTLLW